LRIEEGREQGFLTCSTVDGIKVVVETINRTGQHGVTEAIYCVGKFSHDRRVKVWAAVEDERINLRLDTAREFFKYKMLILHFGAETRSLEQAFAIPNQCVDTSWGRWRCCHVND
jgi:ABC-type ATPase with predicted acetyltransferase domain